MCQAVPVFKAMPFLSHPFLINSEGAVLLLREGAEMAVQAENETCGVYQIVSSSDGCVLHRDVDIVFQDNLCLQMDNSPLELQAHPMSCARTIYCNITFL